MTSYQKRLENIKYLEQCVKELEEIAINLSKQLKKNNIQPKISLLGIKPDEYITYYNQNFDGFYMKLM